MGASACGLAGRIASEVGIAGWLSATRLLAAQVIAARLVAGVLVALLLGLLPAQAEKKVALVIGNASYRNVARLPNPGNDAAVVVALFKAAKFDIAELRRDLGIAEMRRAIREFADVAGSADIAVVYFAGHGIEVDGTNFFGPGGCAAGTRFRC